MNDTKNTIAFITDILAGCSVTAMSAAIKATVPTDKFDALVEAIESLESGDLQLIWMSMKSLDGARDSMVVFTIDDDTDAEILAKFAS